MVLSNAQIQAAGRCNWCLNPLFMSDNTWGDSSFINTGKHLSDGSIAYAVYCTDCLSDSNPNRVAEPKSAINKNTLEEIPLESLTS